MALPDKNSEKAKERKRLFESDLFCCGQCGHIDNPVIEIKGSWLKYGILLVVITFLIILMPPRFSLYDFPFVPDEEWHSYQKQRTEFQLSQFISDPLETFMFSFVIAVFCMLFFNMDRGMPSKLHGCPRCRSKNSMKALKSDDGQRIYDRFYGDRFLKK